MAIGRVSCNKAKKKKLRIIYDDVRKVPLAKLEIQLSCPPGSVAVLKNRTNIFVSFNKKKQYIFTRIWSNLFAFK